MLLHIWDAPGLAQEIRREIQPYTKATQPPSAFGLPEPARLKIDLEGLLCSCPVLKACFYECLRLYSAPMSVRKVKTSFSMGEHNSGGSDPQLVRLEAGTFLVAPLGIQHHDASCFDNPLLFNSRRFLSTGRDGKPKCDPGALKPWGVGESACPGRHFAEKQVLAFVAAILSLWDMEPIGWKGWAIPSHDVHLVVATPRTDLRVLVRPREL